MVRPGVFHHFHRSFLINKSKPLRGISSESKSFFKPSQTNNHEFILCLTRTEEVKLGSQTKVEEEEKNKSIVRSFQSSLKETNVKIQTERVAHILNIHGNLGNAIRSGRTKIPSCFDDEKVMKKAIEAAIKRPNFIQKAPGDKIYFYKRFKTPIGRSGIGHEKDDSGNWKRCRTVLVVIKNNNLTTGFPILDYSRKMSRGLELDKGVTSETSSLSNPSKSQPNITKSEELTANLMTPSSDSSMNSESKLPNPFSLTLAKSFCNIS